MLKIWFFHALEYLDRLGCWCGSPKDYSNHWPSLTFMGNTAPTEKQENQVWVAQGKSTILCHFGLLTALMKLIRTISSSPSSCCSSTPPPRRPQYPEMYTGSNEVWGDVTMLTITDFSLDHIMLLVFATLISPSPSIRCSFIYHSLHAAIVFSRIVDSVYLVCIHNGWWFSYPVIWFGPSEGRNDEASWLWPSSRPNQIYLILMTYCTWQFLVSLGPMRIVIGTNEDCKRNQFILIFRRWHCLRCKSLEALGDQRKTKYFKREEYMIMKNWLYLPFRFLACQKKWLFT